MEQTASFGEWLMEHRQNLHLQRAELAARIGCAVVTLRKIEADERRPSRQLAEQLAEQLAISPPQREVFIRVARGELGVDHLTPPRPNFTGPTNLPYPTTSFSGRTQEVAAIKNSLARSEVRLLTLIGPPGVGKTRLALEAASELREGFADGVFLVPLAPLREPGLVLVAVSHALHIGAAGGPALAERLGRYLRTRRVLLVLDNFEHILAAAPHLTQLLEAAPHLKLLVTSRSALELSGEHRFNVKPLFVPSAAETLRAPLTALQAVERYPAVGLFIQRARAVKPDLVLTAANMQIIGEICRRLDGLPLAIEFAAARSALFTPQELLAQLDNRSTLLSSGARDLPPRHMTLWRAIDWSYGLLSATDQLLFRRLSVFVGDFTLVAVKEVCNSDGAVGPDVFGGITALVAGSLLQRHEGYDGHSRFEMLETVREYALNQLTSSGEAGAVARKHAGYFLGLAEAAEAVWDGPTEWAWTRRLVSVRSNLRAALRWSLETPDPEVALRLNSALLSFWTTCTVLSEARRWVEGALALAQPNRTPELKAVEAKTLNVAGYLTVTTSDYSHSLAYFERGLALYRELGDSRGIAWSIRGCAFVQMSQERYAEAAQLLTESRKMCEASGDAWGLAWSLYALAFLDLARNALDQARPSLEKALVHLRRQNMTFGVFRALLALGHTVFEQGEVAHSKELYREGLLLSREIPMLTFITTGLEGLGMVAAAQGLPGRAARLCGAAEALREITDERRLPGFQRAYDHTLTAARGLITPAEWAAAWAAGRSLTAAQAIDEGLEEAYTTPSSAELTLFTGGGSF